MNITGKFLSHDGYASRLAMHCQDIPENERLDLKGYGSQTIEIHLLDELPIAIRFRVIREGKLIFCKDGLAFHRIVADIIREYLDSAPLIDMHSRHAIGISR